MDINSVLQYFRDYESEVKFQQSSLKNVKGYDYSSSTLKNPERLEQDLLYRKANYLLGKIEKDENIKIITNPGDKNHQFLLQTIEQAIFKQENELLKECLNFKNNFSEKKILTDVQTLAEDNNCFICYPVLERDDVRHPLFVFDTTLQHGRITVNDIHVNFNALTLLVSHLTDNFKNDVEQLYAKEIQSILHDINNLNAPATISEGLDSAISVINAKLPELSIRLSELTGIKTRDGWSFLSTVFITLEMLEEFKEPPFRKEIELLMQKLTKKSQKQSPEKLKSPLSNYLLGNNTSISFDQMKNRNFFHFGSYTGAYAVNKKQWHVLNGLNNARFLSVNGPPGTGKTTLLKEIIADEIVKKAQKLIEYWNEKWEYSKKSKVFISPMKGENAHSIVVTSTNNKAVDNIGKELLSEVSYFSQFVSERVENNQDAIAGLMCARLGNKRNIDQFRAKVLNPLKNGLQSNDSDYPETEEQTVADFKELKASLRGTENKINLYRQKTEFCLNRELIDENYNQIKSKKQLEIEIKKLSQVMVQLKNKYQTILQEQTDAEDLIQRQKKEEECLQADILKAEKEERELYTALEIYQSYNKSKLLNFLPKRKRFLKQYPSELYIKENIKKVQCEHSSKSDQLDENKQILAAKISEVKSLGNRMDEVKSELNEQKAKIETKQSDIELLKQKEQAESQLGLSPHTADNINQYGLIHHNDAVMKKRNQLFKLALRVIEQYIWKHRKAILDNINFVSNDNYLFQPFYSETQSFSATREYGLRAAWETFFLCFPVVTTTLHSFKSPNFQMLDSFMDLLLVDESGQVLPQYLTAPLYRMNRALIVGDVMQIAPVRPAVHNMLEQSKIPEDKWELFDITKKSAQHYADRHSDIFEMMGNQKTGLMLEEHRRCEPAIAAFSNDYVYSGKLDIFKDDDHDKLFGNNLIGIDVRGTQTSHNVNKWEATICKRIVDMMIDRYGESIKRDIGIITPFRNQKKHVEEMIKDVDAGTVHTFQGQEKKYILFSSVVNDRAASFVGSSPNLLNVAVTRAKEQFIFIGNFDAVEASGNYLSDLLNTINQHGKYFSIFNTMGTGMDVKQNKELFQIFASKTSEYPSKFGRFLYNTFPENTIIGAKNNADVLIYALAKAEKCIDIISPWLNPELILEDEERSFNRGVRYALQNNTDIQIMFGYNKNPNASINDIDSIYDADVNNHYITKERYTEAVNHLMDQLQEGLKYKPPLHVKLLLVDKKYLIIGSHNWLSNKATQETPKEEISVVLTEKESIDYVVNYFDLREGAKKSANIKAEEELLR